MGACQCIGETTEREFENETKIIPTNPNKYVKPQEHHQHKTNEPTAEFAQPIQQFPQLSHEVKTTKENMKSFNLDSQNTNVEGQALPRAYQLSNDIIYEGEWKNGMMHGRGKYYLPDHSYLECRSKYNKPIGQCLFIKDNGDYYQGQIKQYMANGYGTSQNDDISYVGQFFNNLPHGHGREVGSNYTYEGEYHFGTKLKGKLTWNLDLSYPSTYDGYFHEQKFNGIGVLKTQKGIYEGQFIDNNKSGFGVFKYRNGSRFEGNYYKDKKNGPGRVYNPEGKIVLTGKWTNDQPPQQ